DYYCVIWHSSAWVF
nr:immunoglobulin light chain junction region [Macaca mulatta]MOY05457.1 immunoglobulin light chain junction region [Macaca mulatta]MOY05526.1 immunoglobulin light chain junction region [Macaca mulatta]MOY05976.1 immunoglobulin light chain junction region [Macaca mulatta]MOY06408.1 immunoglobulin light chain junction region [Macaca mulatta]